ncbi:Ferrichrome-iron receptor [Nitrospira sp. KM1]|uniref:TonB-dependent siderophore receptor n=1 Tax=Nitrospira sp. KM1 TaxID=1936990 RepID=UPI0013A75649|nr:TonB-dependent siderophore receptor [Nitrospira sp. KM1]BCA56575.1 Ferrichrome-iron receptor [Nitrospira sp. KM1]
MNRTPAGRSAFDRPAVLRVIAVIVLLSMVLVGHPSHAQPADAYDFDIPSQPLDQALKAFAEKTDLLLSYEAGMTAGRRSAGVSGRYTSEEALRRLLSGTGLDYRFANDKTVTLQPADGSMIVPIIPPPLSEASSAELGAVQKPVKVPEILVKDVRERDNDTKSYVAEEASTATRTDTPIRDVPQSIQVITRKVIEEQRAFRLAEGLQNVSGVITNRPSQGLNDSFLVRGFAVDTLYRNGLVDPANILVGTDSYNLQRLEVLKGPASVLYGQSDPSGIINVVTKKPLADPYYSTNVMFGSYNFYRTELDATGPLNSKKTLLYRINVVGQKAESFVDYVKRDLVAVAPALSWLIDSRTTLTVEAEYMRRWVPSYNGVPALGTVLPNINGEIPRNRNTSLGEAERQERAMTRVGYDLTHQLNNNWAIRNAYRYTVFEGIKLLDAFPLALAPDQRTLSRAGIDIGNSAGSMWHRHFHNTFTNLTGHFDLLGMDHRLLAGIELRQDKTDPSQGSSRNAPDLDIFAPNYSLTLSGPTDSFLIKSDMKAAGVYLQDLMAILPNLKFLGGVRFDYVHQSVNPTEDTLANSDDTGISPRLGLVYQPIEPVSLYTSWTRGFLPNAPNSINPNGQLFKPERSTQYEMGIKSFFLNDRISTTLAWYHLTRENLLTPDPTLGGLGFMVQTGEQRSQGVEFDVTASLTDGWNIIGSYAYTDAEVTKDNDVNLLNKRLAMVPYNKATLWSTYFFQEGTLSGFGVGGGVFGYTRGNASIFGSQVSVPGYVRVDAALYYNHDLKAGNWLHAKQVNMAVNFRNIFDQGYIETTFNSTTQFFFGEPRTVLATVGLKF